MSRVINLSSAAAFGAASANDGVLSEATPAAPESLYAITKFASEAVSRRLAAHWGLDVVSVRLSAVFGRWERDTGVRDTLSPQAQILEAAASGHAAILQRPGERDWIYATDVAEAILALIETKATLGPLYNVSTGRRWSALAWGQAFARTCPRLLLPAGLARRSAKHRSSCERRPALARGRSASARCRLVGSL